MNTTQRSSRHTNVPGSSPAMILLKTVPTGANVVVPYSCRVSEVAAPPVGETTSLLTIPNLITLLRLLCLPLFLYLLFGLDNRLAAGWLLAGLGATDWVDGYLARRLGQVSEFGKKFDPTVDRLLFIVAIIAIIIDGAAPAWFCWAVLIRELLVGGAVVIATVVFHMP